MNVLDVNVLIALFRPDHVHHERATTWWDASQQAGKSFTVPDVVAVGFCRLVTNRRIYSVPATFAEACDFLGALRAQDLSLGFVADPRTMAEFERLGHSIDVRGDLVTDTYIAAVASSYGATVVTFDRDFRRFDGLRVFEPA